MVMSEYNESDEKARHRVEPHVGTGKPVIIKIMGQRQNIVGTIDEITDAHVHGIKRVLVKITNTRGHARMRVYACNILAVQTVLTEKKDETEEGQPGVQ